VEIFVAFIERMVFLDGKRKVTLFQEAAFRQDVVVDQKICRKNNAPMKMLAAWRDFQLTQQSQVFRVCLLFILVAELKREGRTLHVNNTLGETLHGWERNGGLPFVHVQRVNGLLDVEALVFESFVNDGRLKLDREGMVALWMRHVVHQHEWILFGAIASSDRKRAGRRGVG